jgi:branched-subunit amino acid ABC-type transport system permease component
MTVAQFTLDFELLGPTVAIGASQAGLYGLLAVALVLTFRVSRTVSFVHGGVAVVGALGYWVLSFDPESSIPGYRPGLPGPMALVLIVLLGGLIGAAYGAVVMGRRMSRLPRMTLTTFSLGVMLVLAGLMTSVWYISADAIPPSPFGEGQYQFLGWSVSRHRIIAATVAVVVVAILGVVMTRTRSGVQVRAIADDVEASEWAGMKLHVIGIAVYALSAAIAAMAGAMMTPIVGPDPFNIFFLFLRALTVAVVGGFTSFTLALGGAVVLGLVDTSLRTGLVGGASIGQREMVIMGVIFVLVFLITWRRPVLELADESS